MKREILTETCPSGSSLPTERELVATTGLGRGSVREALRILEVQDLVPTRADVMASPRGAAHRRAAGQPHQAVRTGSEHPLRSLVEVRQALEPMVASAFAVDGRPDPQMIVYNPPTTALADRTRTHIASRPGQRAELP